jgi:hypothetical protein
LEQKATDHFSFAPLKISWKFLWLRAIIAWFWCHMAESSEQTVVHWESLTLAPLLPGPVTEFWPDQPKLRKSKTTFSHLRLMKQVAYFKGVPAWEVWFQVTCTIKVHLSGQLTNWKKKIIL